MTPSLQLIDEREALGSAVLERQQDAEEHDLVLKQLEKQNGSKRAWRLVGDVLIERTVAEMIPEVTKNRDNLLAVAQNFKTQLEAKQKELFAFQEKYNIRIKGYASSGNGAPPGSTSEKSSAQGVLVNSS